MTMLVNCLTWCRGVELALFDFSQPSWCVNV